jgi:hypothetical protein
MELSSGFYTIEYRRFDVPEALSSRKIFLRAPTIERLQSLCKKSLRAFWNEQFQQITPGFVPEWVRVVAGQAEICQWSLMSWFFPGDCEPEQV